MKRRSQRQQQQRQRQDEENVPRVYRQMLAEVSQDSAPQTGSNENERPLKRRRRGAGGAADTAQASAGSSNAAPGPSGKGKLRDGKDQNGAAEAGLYTIAPEGAEDMGDSDAEVGWEDVALPAAKQQDPLDALEQLADDSEDYDWDQNQNEAGQEKENEEEEGALNIVIKDDVMLGKGKEKTKKKRTAIASGLSAAQRQLRTDIHKMHLICLLAHARIRNHWCNDDGVQVWDS
jgi:xeroderma pigmentosum group C-complementing protein